MSFARYPAAAAALVATVLLAACGGGDDDTTGSAGTTSATSATASTGGGTLTLTAAAPAANNTTIDVSTATTSGNNARPADSFSATAYCEVFWENAVGANGSKYAVQVYFRQSDGKAMHVSVVEGSGTAVGFSVYDNASGNPIGGVAVDVAKRTLTFSNKVLAGASTETATANGTLSFAANSGTPACGA